MLTDAHTPLAALRNRLRAFNDERDWALYHTPRNLAMALSVEAAELLQLYLWSQDGALPVEDRRPRVAAEAADVLISLLNFCEAEGLDLAAAVEAKLLANAERYPAEVARGRLEKYDELRRT
jgi:NTP pyrophosphatase (non-canonical NTP hydrolase)